MLAKASKFLFSSIFTAEGANSYILQQIKKRSLPLYFASAAYPKPLRPAFYALNLLVLEQSSVFQTTGDKAIAEAKLNFWQGSINKIFKRQKPQQQPLSIVLEQTISSNPLTKIYFDRIHTQWNLSLDGFQTLTTMANACQAIFTNHIMIHLQLLRVDFRNQNLIKAAELVGRALGIVFFIRKIPFHLRNGWLMVPQDLQTKHNFSMRNLWERRLGKPVDQLHDSVLDLAAFARQCLIMAGEVRELPQRAHTALIMAVQAQYFLEQLEKYDFNTFQKGVHRNSIWQVPSRMRKLNKAGSFLQPFSK